MAALLLAAVAATSGAIRAAVSDPFAGDYAAQMDTKAPEVNSVQLGDWGVSEQTGAATYGISIEVPPGRRGVQPKLSLGYSSQAPLRGGVAAGWSLDLPSVELDVSNGTLSSAVSYRTSFAGTTSTLVEVPDLSTTPGGASFRMQHDDAFVRFERLGQPIVASQIGNLPVRQQVYREPTAYGYRLDWCLRWGQDCGQPAADRFCQKRMGPDARAVDLQKASNIGAARPTFVLGDPAAIGSSGSAATGTDSVELKSASICSTSGCDGFESITCESTGQVASAGEAPRTSIQPKLGADRLDWCTHSRQCGKGAADGFCEMAHGLGWESSTGQKAQDIGVQTPTSLIGAPSKQICSQEYCDGFETITCTSTDAATSGGVAYGWMAVDRNGTRHYFGTRRESTDGTTVWSLDRQVDALGNAIEYLWRPISNARGETIDRAIDRIEYTGNEAAGLYAHAMVQFEYAPELDTCPDSEVPIGSRVSHLGDRTRYQGSARLDAIVTSVRDQPGSGWREVRRTALGYDANALSCDDVGAPLRYLTQVDRSATAPDGVTTTLPPITFDYADWSPENQGFTQVAVAPTTRGNSETLASTLMNVDGDGIPDRGEVYRDRYHRCALRWERGLSGGGFAPTKDLVLPTLKWGSDSSGTYARENSAESCTLLGQTTSYANLSNGTCQGGLYHSVGTFQVYRFMDVDGDGRDDLVTAIHADTGLYDPTQDPDVLPYDPIGYMLLDINSPWNPRDPCNVAGADLASCEDGEGTMPDSPAPDPIICEGTREAQKHNNSYVWRVYRNDGNGFAPFRRSASLAPFSLAPEGNEGSRLGHGSYSTSDQAILDIDGDGRVDLVDARYADDPTWAVYPSNGRGAFGPRTDWFLPSQLNPAPAQSQIDRDSGRTRGTMGLGDVNGDGLPDLLVSRPTGLEAYANHGRGFSADPMPLGAGDGLYETAPDGTFRSYRYLRVDVDGDGLADLLDLRTSPPQFHPSVGDRFLSPRSLPYVWKLAQRQLRFVEGSPAAADYHWELWSDFRDGDGDGIADLLGWSGDNLSQFHFTAENAPPRRLVEVDLHTGGHIRFDYSPVNRYPAVDRQPGADRDLPQLPWVVETLTVEDDFGPTSATSYQYEDPIYDSKSGRPNDPRQFLGFQRVVKHLPSDGNAQGRIESDYVYAGDGDVRGRLARRVRFDGEVPATVTVVDPWVREALFGRAAGFSHKTRELTITCLADATLESCEAQEENVLRQEYRFEPYSIDEQVVLYLATEEQSGEGRTPGALDRIVRREFADVRYGADEYRVLQTEESLYEVSPVTGDFARIGRTATDFDDLGLPIAQHVWRSENEVTTTFQTFDAAGNVLSVARPSGATMRTEYDAFALSATYTVNAVGHAVSTLFDLGTGRRLEAGGPNAGQLEAWEIDGFGRAIRHFKAFEGMGLVLVDETVYRDLLAPRAMEARRLVNAQTGSSTQSLRQLDGRGRVISEANALGASTQYAYDAAGNLELVEMPNPADDGARVFFEYRHDGAGRLRTFLHPGGETAITYTGLSEAVEERGADGTSTLQYRDRDVFGRLTAVGEIDGAGASALTEYFYDARGQAVEIVDADENITQIGRDWVGRRIHVTRGNRSWFYTYDENGNLVAETTPAPTGASLAEHTTVSEYDPIDRLVRRSPASRGLSDARRAELGIGPVAYFYDGSFGGAANATGRLTGVVLPFGSVTYQYDLRGNRVAEERTVTAGPVASTQWEARQFNAMDLPTSVEHDDGTVSETTYDERALPRTIRWLDPRTGVWAIVADFDRSQAGQVLERRTSFGQRRAYTYDALGRPSTDSIESAGAVRAWRHYSYNGVGDLIRIDGANEAAPAAATYAYDGMHRLLDAQGPAGYAANLGYSASGNVTDARIGWDVRSDRDVIYEYGAVDPQAVDRLLNRTGSPGATFAYDLAGNMVQRDTDEGRFVFTWDGEDQLREASSTSGREIYLYDHERKRVLALNDQGARFWFGPSETHFDATGAETRRLIDIGGGIARFERAIATALGAKSSKGRKGRPSKSTEPETTATATLALELHYADALRNVMLVLDEGGATAASFLYGAFGEVVNASGEAGHRRQFNGKEHDAFTGLRYYGFRYYDPFTLRWSSGDPKYRFAPEVAWDEPQRMNLYAFSQNNPLRYLDPDGRDTWEAMTGMAKKLGLGAVSEMAINSHSSMSKMSKTRPLSVMEQSALEKVFPSKKTGVNWKQVRIQRGFVGDRTRAGFVASGNQINVHEEYSDMSIQDQLELVVHEGTHVVQAQRGIWGGATALLDIIVHDVVGIDPYSVEIGTTANSSIEGVHPEAQADVAGSAFQIMIGEDPSEAEFEDGSTVGRATVESLHDQFLDLANSLID